jgi:hypothetical protein
MYLDDEGHVTWRGIGEYSDADEALRFAQSFPSADLSELGAFASAKACYCDQYARGNVYFTINGARCEMTKEDADKHTEEGKVWRAVARTCGFAIAP